MDQNPTVVLCCAGVSLGPALYSSESMLCALRGQSPFAGGPVPFICSHVEKGPGEGHVDRGC